MPFLNIKERLKNLQADQNGNFNISLNNIFNVKIMTIPKNVKDLSSNGIDRILIFIFEKNRGVGINSILLNDSMFKELSFYNKNEAYYISPDGLYELINYLDRISNLYCFI